MFPFPGIGTEEVGKTLFIDLRPKVSLRCGEVFQRCFPVNSGFQTSLPAEKRGWRETTKIKLTEGGREGEGWEEGVRKERNSERG